MAIKVIMAIMDIRVMMAIIAIKVIMAIMDIIAIRTVRDIRDDLYIKTMLIRIFPRGGRLR